MDTEGEGKGGEGGRGLGEGDEGGGRKGGEDDRGRTAKFPARPSCLSTSFQWRNSLVLTLGGTFCLIFTVRGKPLDFQDE